jgi:transcriptional regulator with XRE-family HTH domain
LAHHSGLSWAAIAQIESGRRQEVRLGSLSALAEALGVTVDYLIGGEGTVQPKLLGHGALIYTSDEQYLGATVPFLVEGVRRADSALVVTRRRQIGLLRDALGDDASLVEFRDSRQWYRSPGHALDGYRQFIKDKFEHGAHWIRVIGEPVWAGRSEAEVLQWTRYESMINIALASAPATIMCPYDERSLDAGVLAGARHTHPEVVDTGQAIVSSTYRQPEEFLIQP